MAKRGTVELTWETIYVGIKVINPARGTLAGEGIITKYCEVGSKPSFQVRYTDGGYATYRHPERFFRFIRSEVSESEKRMRCGRR